MIDRSRPLLSISCLLLLISIAPALQAQENPWPLVEEAGSLVRGTVRGIDKGVDDRLLHIDTSPTAVAETLITVVEPGGLLSERSGIAIGTSGLFMLHTGPLDEVTEFPSAAAMMLAGGYLPLLPDDQQLGAINILRNATATTEDRHTALTRLLASEHLQLHLLALGALVGGKDPDDAALAGNLASHLGSDPRTDAAILEVALDRDWPLASIPLSELFLDSTSPVVSQLALAQIERRGGGEERAELLLAWPGADVHGRLRLLGAYRHLKLPESDRWWTEALVSGDPRLVAAAIDGLGEAKIPGAQEKYRLLLDSPRTELRNLALKGLARTATRGSFDLLREFESGLSTSLDDLPVRKLVADLLKNPWRVLGTRPGPDPNGGW